MTFMTPKILLSAAILALLFHYNAAGDEQKAQSEPPPSAAPEDQTTFLIDRVAEAVLGTEWSERRLLLVEYMASDPAAEVVLRNLPGADPAAQTAGRTKGAMVMHLLRKNAGELKFAAAQRDLIDRAKLRPITWDDVRTVIEQRTGTDLAGFFRQWVDGKGLPDLRIEKAAARRKGGGYEASFDIVQAGTPFELEVPVTVALAGGGLKKETVPISGERKSVSIAVDAEPRAVTLDRDYELPRKLAGAEIPPVFAAITEGRKNLIVLPAGEREGYRPVIDALKRLGAEEREADSLTDADVRDASLVILGEDNPAALRLFGKVVLPAAGMSVDVRKNPWNAVKAVAIVRSRTPQEAEKALPALPALRQSSYASFDQGTVVARGTRDAERGIQVELRQDAVAVDLSALRTLADVIAGAADKKIIYVGEYHDRYAHHDVQLQVVRELHQRDPRLTVGMEMFQRPFQQALDDYIGGRTDEREFLKRSEYFKRWGFDYNLYKPILDFCRAEKVPVAALNTRREITDKVSKSGLDSLSGEERKEIPPQMDFSDDEYRKRLKAVFSEHKSSPDREFDFFYQAQVLWDETMALSVDEFIRKHPDRRMVVIVGGGHIAHSSGIPKRAFRRNGHPYAVILNDPEIERGIADYAVYPPSLEGVAAPRLMTVFREDDGKLIVTGFSRDSPAEKAGLRTGDVVLSADGEPVKDVGDLKLALFFKKSGDVLTVKALRKRFLLGEKERTFVITLN